MFTNYISRPYDFNLVFNGLTFWSLHPIDGGTSMSLSDHEAKLCIDSWKAIVMQEVYEISPEHQPKP